MNTLRIQTDQIRILNIGLNYDPQSGIVLNEGIRTGIPQRKTLAERYHICLRKCRSEKRSNNRPSIEGTIGIEKEKTYR